MMMTLLTVFAVQAKQTELLGRDKFPLFSVLEKCQENLNPAAQIAKTAIAAGRGLGEDGALLVGTTKGPWLRNCPRVRVLV